MIQINKKVERIISMVEMIDDTDVALNICNTAIKISKQCIKNDTTLKDIKKLYKLISDLEETALIATLLDASDSDDSDDSDDLDNSDDDDSSDSMY